MAKRSRRFGQRLVVVAGRDLYTVRMYDTFARIWSGWTRIFVGSFSSLSRILRSAIVLFFFTFVPWLAFALTAIVPGWRDWSLTGMTTIAAEACVFQLATMVVFYRLSRVSPFYGLVYPVGGLVAMGALLNAARCVSAGGSFSWRGTRYRAAAVGGDFETVATPDAA